MELFAIVIVVTVVTELYFSVTFNPGYFRFGIPVFSSHIPVKDKPDMGNLAAKLALEFPGGFWSNAIVFQPLTSNEIGLREKLGFFRRSSSILHGLIRYVPEERTVVLTGMLNWYFLVIILFIGKVAWDGFQQLSFFPLIFVVFLALFYGVDYVRYKRIAEALAKQQ